MKENRNIIVNVNISELSKEGIKEFSSFLNKYGYTKELGLEVIDL